MPFLCKPGIRYYLLILAFSVSFISWAISYGQDSTPSSESASLPDTQPELERLRMQTDDRVTETKQSLKSWETVVTELTNAQRSVPGASAPPQSAYQSLTEAVKTRDLNGMKIRLSSLMQGVQSVYDYSTTSTYSYATYAPSARSAPDPEIQTFLNGWRTKVDAVFFKLNITPYFNGATWYSNQSPQTTISPEDLELLKDATSADALVRLKQDVGQVLDGLLKDATSRRDQAKQAANDAKTRLDEVTKKLGKTKLEINQLAIELGLPLFCGTVLLMLIVPIVFQARGIGTSSQVDAIFASGILVEIITVLLLTMSILILGLSGKIEGPVLGTLLGGISGYVLNRFRDKKGDDPEVQVMKRSIPVTGHPSDGPTETSPAGTMKAGSGPSPVRAAPLSVSVPPQ